METYRDASPEEVDEALQRSWAAFRVYKKVNLEDRAQFLHRIADQLEARSEPLLGIAAQETHLDKDRLGVELKRTVFQLRSYGDACARGAWLDIRIDTHSQLSGGSINLRKMLVPLGPVVVFGASNFPFAYSTAGGDTACALAAGCPVLVKAHPAHAHTSESVALAVKEAAKQCGLPEDVFIHVHGAAFEVGKALVEHPHTKAVGFTGSFAGGKALADLAQLRPVPIPVFAEMGSVNPVFLLPGKLQSDAASVASLYTASITQSAGQFCTNPGILVGMEGEGLTVFRNLLAEGISAVKPVPMLHEGIAKSFVEKREKALAQPGVVTAASTSFPAAPGESIPTLAEVPAAAFLKNPLLHEEVFGPFSLLVACQNEEEMMAVAQSLPGQLTASLMATEAEALKASELVAVLREKCGRLIMNGVPTGVEVALAMHHGGPYPATTDSRFTAVGADGIKRFARPVCFQNWSDGLLPPELQNANPLGLWRTVNDQLTLEPIG
jgi:NADP-dependent aldehyde dehydrogenase